MNRYKILFTGAHHNSALSTLDWMQKNGSTYDAEFDFYWVGHKNVRNSKVLSPEYLEVTKRKAIFLNLKTGKLYRFKHFSYIPHFLYNLLLIPWGFIQSFFYLLQYRPDLIISFGGYLSVPIIINGWILRIPSVAHEQTTVVGLANKITQPFVKRVFTAWPVEYYEGSNIKKFMYVGLPLRDQIIESLTKKQAPYEFPVKKPVLYITGGKAGSHFINNLVLSSLPDLTKMVNLIWSAGHQNYEKVKLGLSKIEYEDSILLKEYFMEDEIGRVYSTADVILSRAGAHTIYEIGILQKPAILIPIPWASNDEQRNNALILEESGIAKVLEEDQTGKEVFLDALREMLSSNVKPQNLKLILDGQEKLGHEILKILKKGA